MMVGKLNFNLIQIYEWRQYLILSLFFAFISAFAKEASENFKVGDWVFRSGRGQESLLIRTISHSEYSHIGMIVAVKPQVMIVHATTNDDINHPNQVIKSSFAAFSSKKLTDHVLVVRPTFMGDIEKQAIARYLLKTVGQSFVLVSEEDSPRYCTTIIYNAIRTEYPDFKLHWQTVTLPIAGGKYLFPQAFLDYPDTEIVYDNLTEF